LKLVHFDTTHTTCHPLCRSQALYAVVSSDSNLLYPHRRPSNGPPTEMETKRLRTFIDTHEQLAQDLNERILQEEENIKMANSAISNLQDVIPRVESALRTQEEISESLKNAVEKFEKINVDGGNIPADEPQSRGLRETVISSITSYVTRGVENVRTQLSASNAEAENTHSQLFTMKEELSGWLFCRDLSVGSLEYLQESKNRLKGIIENSQRAFSRQRNLPREVWERVLMFYTSHLADTKPVEYRLLPFGPLSHVCRLWRSICLCASPISCQVPIHTAAGWRSFDPAIITGFVARRSTPSTLLVDLSTMEASQIFAGLQLASVTQHRNIDAATRELDNGSEYHLVVRIKEWSIDYGQQIVDVMPFNRPTHLTIESVVGSTARSPTITGFYPPSTVTHLTLTNILRYVELQGIPSSVEHLVIKFIKFKREGKIRYFEPPLHITSLHIICGGCYDIDSTASRIVLPHLQELGLTLPHINLAEKLDLPSKLRLILYNNTTKGLMKPSWENYGKLFGSTTHVTFKRWRTHVPPAPNMQWGAATVLHDNLSAFKRLDSVTFIGSFVEGTSLIKLVDRNNGPEVSLMLKEITIDGCKGITRHDCEEVIQHIQKLRVIV
jgi:hypothetical protein